MLIECLRKESGCAEKPLMASVHIGHKTLWGGSGRVINVLYYLSVVLICVHYADDETLDHFLHELHKVLKRYAG